MFRSLKSFEVFRREVTSAMGGVQVPGEVQLLEAVADVFECDSGGAQAQGRFGVDGGGELAADRNAFGLASRRNGHAWLCAAPAG
jgi:hypothetical protein